MTVMNLSLHCLGGEGDISWRWGGLLLGALYYLCGSDRRSALSQRRRGAAAGSCGAGRGGGEGRSRCRGGAGGRGGGCGRGLDRRWVISWGRGSSGGCFGRSRFAVVHLQDVLLEVSDPVLLHRQRAVKLHLAEADTERKTKIINIYCGSSKETNYKLTVVNSVPPSVAADSVKTFALQLYQNLSTHLCCQKIPNDSLFSL